MGAISSSLEMYDKIKEKIERITPLLNATDNYINQSSRLALMNDGLQTQSQLQDKIYQSAQMSRSSYDGLANSVAELGLRNASAFKSNDETIAFAELMNKSFKISGASISQSSDYMSQLTQAMTDGSIQGGEFESMMENAPMLAQAVGKYTGKSIGDLQDMSSKGELTANIIKNSLFNAADEINGKFSTMPMTFGDIWVGIKNKAINNFSGIMQKINDFINTDAATSIINNITNSILSLGSVLGWIVDGIISISTFFNNNWSIIEPIIWGIVAAIMSYNAAVGILNIASTISDGLELAGAISKAIHTKATLEKTSVTAAETAAQWGLNTALLACPLAWIVIVIIAVIAAIIAWSAHTYGLQATWLMVTNFLITAWDTLKICALMMVYGIINMWDSLCAAGYQLSVGIQDALGNMRAGGLMILQNFVNGAIDLINDLINTVNKIPGVSIEAVSKVTFGTEAMAENEAEKAGRNKDLAAYMSQKDAAKKAREDSLKNMVNKLDADIAKRQAKINAAKEAHANGNDNKFNLNNILGGAGSDLGKWNKAQGPGQLANGLDPDSKKRLENIDDKIDVSNEHLEMLRDLAEMESVQNFVTLTPTVQVTTGDIKQEADINKIIAKIETYMENELVNSAEGVYA